nr:hypothetical protein [Tanacetum cinerariifolium]
SKKAKSTEPSKGTTKLQSKSNDKSAQAEEMDPEWNECKTFDNKPTQKWLSDLAKAEKPSKTFDDLMSTLTNFSVFAMNRMQISDLTQDILIGQAYKLLEGTYRMTTVNVNIWYGYGHFEEIEVRRFDQQLYKFMEGDFPRLHLNNIEDMLLLVGQNKLFNLKGKDIIHLAVTLRVIYLDNFERNRLMCSHELYKFSDGTLISVRDKLKDMANNLELGYTSVMPRRKWSNLDKKWSHIMVKDIDRHLLEIRLMRSLEKFISGKEYEEDLRLLQRTILLCHILFYSLRYDKKEKSKKLGRVPTEMELILKHTQQGISYEVLVSTEGVKELKRNDKIKGVKKEALLIHLGKNRINTYAIRNTQLLSGIEDSRHVTQ